MSRRTALGPAAAVAVIAVALAAVSTADAQAQATAAKWSKGQHVGVANCSGTKCHNKQEASGDTNVLQNEITIWKNSDRHVHAFEVLANKESQQIAANLKLASSASESPRCLVCHALATGAGGTGAIVDRESGISCEGCHGPAGGWIDGHQFPSPTRHGESVSQGMFDLRKIDVRAKTCLRCHLGENAGQEVDHDLIAAGHPELFFELDTFTDTEQMGVHWTPFENLRNRKERAETHRVRAFLVGQVASLRLSLALLADQLRAGAWPEFAAMTCDDCHHVLAEGAWRRARGYSGRPGIAAWSPARWTVARHVLAVLAADRFSELEAEIRSIADGVAELRRPAAETLTHVERAIVLAGELGPVVDRFASQDKLPADTLEKILRAIVADPEFKRAGDRQSARQIAAAAFSLTDGMAYPRALKLPVSKWFDAVYEAANPIDAKGAPKRYDREAFLSALSKMPAVLR